MSEGFVEKSPAAISESNQAGSTDRAAPAIDKRFRLVLALISLLGISACLSLYRLDQSTYTLDEMWTVEVTMGRGSLHQHLPIDRIIDPPPQLFSLSQAAPWWQLWSHIEITHPPLYPILLRWWEDLFGDQDASGRLFSACSALIAVALMFDVVRLQAGIGPAFWAGLLMTVACPQVEHARMTRGYTMLTAIGLFTADALIRIQILGPSRRRVLFFALAVLGTAFTHYFAAGTLLAILFYAAWKLPAQRRTVVLIYLAIGVFFLITWGPFMWQQRHLFATDDPSTLFLTSGAPQHGRLTLLRVLIAPVVLLFAIDKLPLPIALILGAVFYVIPILLARKNHFLLFWIMWFVGTVAVVAALDLCRMTNHLYYIRYTLLAGPAVYALIPQLFRTFGRWPCHVASALVVTACLFHLPDVYLVNPADPRQVVGNLPTRPTSADLLIVAAPADNLQKAFVEILRLSRYIDPLPCPIAVLSQPANPAVLAAAGQKRLVFILARGDGPATDYRAYLPQAHVLDMHNYPGLGKMWTLQFDLAKK